MALEGPFDEQLSAADSRLVEQQQKKIPFHIRSSKIQHM